MLSTTGEISVVKVGKLNLETNSDTASVCATGDLLWDGDITRAVKVNSDFCCVSIYCLRLFRTTCGDGGRVF